MQVIEDLNQEERNIFDKVCANIKRIYGDLKKEDITQECLLNILLRAFVEIFYIENGEEYEKSIKLILFNLISVCCGILDLFARKIVAFKASPHINTPLAKDTLVAAVASRGKSAGIILHTDRGSQFTSKDFRQCTNELNIIQSFSAKGHPYDNAGMECFFKYLKKKETDRRNYSSPDELKVSLFSYIESFYNSVRPHSHNNGLSPNQKEADFMIQ